MSGSGQTGASNFGFLILVVAAFLVGAGIYSLAGTAYLSAIVNRVTNMSASDLGIWKDPETERMESRLPAEIERSQRLWTDSQRQYDDFARKYGRH
jgi:hypothetical protein